MGMCARMQLACVVIPFPGLQHLAPGLSTLELQAGATPTYQTRHEPLRCRQAPECMPLRADIDVDDQAYQGRRARRSDIFKTPVDPAVLALGGDEDIADDEEEERGGAAQGDDPRSDESGSGADKCEQPMGGIAGTFTVGDIVDEGRVGESDSDVGERPQALDRIEDMETTARLDLQGDAAGAVHQCWCLS
jgi:hypothetical protein